jgi:hypothetical protein
VIRIVSLGCLEIYGVCGFSSSRCPPFDARGVTLVLSIDDDSVVMRLQNRLDGVGNLYGEPFEGLQAFRIWLYYPRQFTDAIET